MGSQANLQLSSAKSAETRNDNEVNLILGLCTGNLAAAAARSTNDLVQMIPLAVEATIAAFRIGAHVSTVAQRISPFQDPNAGWSVIIPGATAAEAVRSFNSQSVSAHGYILS